MENKRVIQVDEKVPVNLLIPLSIQHLLAMFGASVLVPFVFGINPAVVLFMNGFGTLLYIAVTKGKAPAYLGSSFAFLAPAGIVISEMGYEYALGGFVVVGFCGCILAAIIYKFGSDWINVILPPAAMGPVVALIGLELAGSAAEECGASGRNDSAGKCDRVLRNAWRCCFRIHHLPRLSFRYPDSDRCGRGLCGCCLLRNRGFLCGNSGADLLHARISSWQNLTLRRS